MARLPKVRTVDVCYSSGMAKTSSKERAAARRRRADLRDHYRQFLEVRDGRPYNPVLDDPDDPRNKRHWSHGVADGYDVAACRCVLCEEAGSRTNHAKTERRIARRRDELRAIVTDVLVDLLPGLPAEEIDAVAATISEIGRVVNKTTVKIDYQHHELALALENWVLRGGHAVDTEAISDLAATLQERLTR